MRRLTVLSTAYPLAPVGPDAVGGSEQILSALDRALVAAGHRSIVVACEGSTAAGELVTYQGPPKHHAIDPAFTAARRADAACAIQRVLDTEQIDVIHMHGLDFHAYLPPPGPPLLATLHLPPDWYPPAALEPPRPDTWVQCVSKNQLGRAPASPRMLSPIPNGVPVTTLGAIHPRKCSYALMLARICPEKGVHLALQAAHQAGVKLLIGGEIFPYEAHQAYFRDQVAPLLDRDRRYLGPVDFRHKRRLLAAARCLLVPSLCAETSSLVAMEAASCGTPVIAFRAGALPEVVEHGRTGYLVDDAPAMAAAIARIRTIDPERCRATARRRFGLDRMTAAYLKRYHQLARGRVPQAA